LDKSIVTEKAFKLRLTHYIIVADNHSIGKALQSSFTKSID